jgi:hypothetical protein
LSNEPPPLLAGLDGAELPGEGAGWLGVPLGGGVSVGDGSFAAGVSTGAGELDARGVWEGACVFV